MRLTFNYTHVCTYSTAFLARSKLLCVAGLAAGKGQHKGHISVVYMSGSKGSMGKGLEAEASYRGKQYQHR